MSNRGTEQREDTIPDDVVVPPTELVDHGNEPLEQAVDESGDVLGIGALGKPREPHHIGEEHGDDTPFLIGCRLHLCSARRTEPGVRRKGR